MNFRESRNLLVGGLALFLVGCALVLSTSGDLSGLLQWLPVFGGVFIVGGLVGMVRAPGRAKRH
jgi:hypothetical protein